MWLSKFLDINNDVKDLAAEIKAQLFQNRNKKKLTPLEFTILEAVFNKGRISGYDLIISLNKHFAGTWKAKSGTVYPILSKLKKNGFLEMRSVKSPIGPLKTLYNLTDAGEQFLKMKVNKNFLDQVKFLENFLIELSSIYVESFPEKEKEEKMVAIQDLLRETFEKVFDGIHSSMGFSTECPGCGVEIERTTAQFCSHCGTALMTRKPSVNDEFDSVEELNGEID